MTYSYAQMAAVASTNLVERIRELQIKLESYAGDNDRTIQFVEMTSLYFARVCAVLTDEHRQISNAELMQRLLTLNELTAKVGNIKVLAAHPETTDRKISEIRFQFDLVLSRSMGNDPVTVTAVTA